MKELNIFEKSDYRSIISALVGQAKETPGFSLSALARACDIQPSYLTNVLKERAHFSADQAYAVMAELGRTAEEADYVLLLIDYERSGHPKRKKVLLDKLNVLRARNIRSEKYIEAQTPNLGSTLPYYSDPLAPILHIYLGTEFAKQEISGIAKDLSIDTQRASQLLAALKEQGFIQRQGGRWTTKQENLHLPKDSPLLRMHHIAMRALSIDRLVRLTDENYYSFSATVSMTPDAKLQIQAEFLKFIKRSQEIVRTARPEKVMQLHFDLFPWTQ